jgi:preprotein translocase subunit SecE
MDFALLFLLSDHLREIWEWSSRKDLIAIAIYIIGVVANASLLTYFMYF